MGLMSDEQPIEERTEEELTRDKGLLSAHFFALRDAVGGKKDDELEWFRGEFESGINELRLLYPTQGTLIRLAKGKEPPTDATTFRNKAGHIGELVRADLERMPSSSEIVKRLEAVEANSRRIIHNSDKMLAALVADGKLSKLDFLGKERSFASSDSGD